MTRVRLAVLLSGAASLVYQATWVRQLTNATSAATYAQAIIVGVFFAGLGIGAIYPGRRAARSARPLAAYAALEVGAAVAALLSSPALVLLDRVRDALVRSGVSARVALGSELAVASAFLLVPTICMGASLPFVIAHVERTWPEGASRKDVPLLYAINAAGAAMGCVLAGYVLIEHVGLRSATIAGASLSCFAAAVAVWGARATPRVDAPDDVFDAAAAGPARGLLLAASIAGFVGVGAEVLWTRLWSLVVLNTVYAFTQVVVAVLVGVTAGAALARSFTARLGPAALLRTAGILQIGATVGAACVAPLSLLLAGRTRLEADIAAGRSLGGALAVVVVVAVPIALNAAILPMLVRAISGARASRAFGAVYAANTGGCVVGSLVVGLIALPWLGLTRTSVLLEVASLGLVLLLVWWGTHERKQVVVAVAVPFVVVIATHLTFSDVPLQIYGARLPEGAKVLELREGAVSDVLVVDTPPGTRRMWINSSWVAGTGGGHSALGHLPALFVSEPRSAVGIALGTGQTFSASFANGITDFHVVEINPDVVSLSRRWFGQANDHLLDRSGVVIHEEDGRAFLRSQSRKFDLVVIEPLQAWSSGTSSLYCHEFYADARRVLERGGVVAQWIPFYGQSLEETKTMVKTAIDVFPDATLWLDEHDGILLLHNGPMALSPSEIEARIAERHLGADLAAKSLHHAVDVLSLFVLGREGLARWTGGATPLTEDRPFLEFRAARSLGQPSFETIAASLIAQRKEMSLEGIRVAGEDAPPAVVEESRKASDALLADSLVPPDDALARAAALERAIASAPTVAVLRRRYRTLMDAHISRIAARSPSTDVVEKLLQRTVAHDDTAGEAMLNLAVLALRRGDLPVATALVQRAERINRTRARAVEMAARLPP